MLSAEQAVQCVEAGLPVQLGPLLEHGWVWPVIRGNKHLRLVRFEPAEGVEPIGGWIRTIYALLYTDEPVSPEDAVEQMTAYVHSQPSTQLHAYTPTLVI